MYSCGITTISNFFFLDRCNCGLSSLTCKKNCNYAINDAFIPKKLIYRKLTKKGGWTARIGRHALDYRFLKLFFGIGCNFKPTLQKCKKKCKNRFCKTWGRNEKNTKKKRFYDIKVSYNCIITIFLTCLCSGWPKKNSEPKKIAKID